MGSGSAGNFPNTANVSRNPKTPKPQNPVFVFDSAEVLIDLNLRQTSICNSRGLQHTEMVEAVQAVERRKTAEELKDKALKIIKDQLLPLI